MAKPTDARARPLQNGARCEAWPHVAPSVKSRPAATRRLANPATRMSRITRKGATTRTPDTSTRRRVAAAGARSAQRRRNVAGSTTAAWRVAAIAASRPASGDAAQNGCSKSASTGTLEPVSLGSQLHGCRHGKDQDDAKQGRGQLFFFIEETRRKRLHSSPGAPGSARHRREGPCAGAYCRFRPGLRDPCGGRHCLGKDAR